MNKWLFAYMNADKEFIANAKEFQPIQNEFILFKKHRH